MLAPEGRVAAQVTEMIDAMIGNSGSGRADGTSGLRLSSGSSISWSRRIVRRIISRKLEVAATETETDTIAPSKAF